MYHTNYTRQMRGKINEKTGVWEKYDGKWYKKLDGEKFLRRKIGQKAISWRTFFKLEK